MLIVGTALANETPARDLGKWNQLGSDLDETSSSLSLSSDGNIVAIGDIQTLLGYTGRVRIYQWNGTEWPQRGSDIDAEATGDRNGYSVSLSTDGNIVAIGAYENNANGEESGHVRIYQWNETQWIQRGNDIAGETERDRSGISVSLSADGNIVAIGAYGNVAYGQPSGHVRIYQWNGAAWIQRGNDIDGEAAVDASGNSVSLSADGDIVAIGAYGNDGNGDGSGHVRIYQWNGTEWTQQGSDIDGEAAGDYSGWSVSLSVDGSIVAIGARRNDGNGEDSGHVRIYAWDGAAWSKWEDDIDGEAYGDESGHSVSLSVNGNTVAIGAKLNDGNGESSGHVRIYEWTDDGPCTPCVDVTAAAVEQLCKIMVANPPRSVLELQDAVNSTVDTLLISTNICETACDIGAEIDTLINAKMNP